VLNGAVQYGEEIEGAAEKAAYYCDNILVAMRALRTGRTCSFDGDERDILVRPGPRMVEAARLLARCVGETTGK
jgi:hypothetical protein